MATLGCSQRLPGRGDVEPGLEEQERRGWCQAGETAQVEALRQEGRRVWDWEVLLGSCQACEWGRWASEAQTGTDSLGRLLRTQTLASCCGSRVGGLTPAKLCFV